MNRLYINGVEADLDPEQVVSITIKSSSIGNIVSLSFSNSMTLPWTETNNEIFELAKHENSNGDVVYGTLEGRYVYGGLEILPACRIVVSDSDESGVKINLYDNRIDLFTFIKGKKVNELNHIDPTGWTAADADSARLSTSGLISAVIKWGDRAAVYEFTYFLPSFFYHDMVTAVLESTGLTLSGAIISDSDFTDLIIPYGLDKWEYPESFGLPYAFKVGKNASSGGYQSFVLVTGGNYYVVDMNTEFYQGSAEVFDLSLDHSVTPTLGVTGEWLNVTLQASINLEVDTWAVGQSFRVRCTVRDSGGCLRVGTSL